MAFTDTSINLSTTFDLSGSTKTFLFTDTTDYVATHGIALADVVGIFTIIDPTGNTVYQNSSFATPDIDADVSLSFDTVELPLDVNRQVLNGNYSIQYRVEVTGATDPGQYLSESTFNYNLTVPCLKLDVSYDIEQATLTSVDVTDYGDYLVSVSRVHTLVPPVESGLSNTGSSLERVTATPIATKTWTAKIESTITVDIGDGPIVYLLDGQIEIEVVKVDGNCDLSSCIQSISDKYESQKNTNPTLASATRQELDDAIMYYELYKMSLQCGNQEKAAYYKDKVLVCTTKCGCETDACSETASADCDTSVSEVINPFEVTTIAGPQGNKGDKGDTGAGTPGSDGNDGAPGDPGDDGDDGVHGGFSSKWLFDTSTATGPSATNLRLNNSTPASVTEIYVNDNNADSLDFNDFLESFDNGGAFGRIKISKVSDPTKYWYGEVLAVTDNSSDFTLGVSHINSSAIFSASDELILSFAQSGENNVISLHNDFVTEGSSSGSLVLIGTKEYTLLRKTLSKVGDGLSIKTSVSKVVDHAGTLNITIGGGGTTGPASWNFPATNLNAAIKVDIFYVTGTTFYYRLTVDYTDATGAWANTLTLFGTKTLISAQDFLLDHLDIQVRASTDGAETTNALDLQVTKIQ